MSLHKKRKRTFFSEDVENFLLIMGDNPSYRADDEDVLDGYGYSRQDIKEFLKMNGVNNTKEVRENKENVWDFDIDPYQDDEQIIDGDNIEVTTIETIETPGILLNK